MGHPGKAWEILEKHGKYRKSMGNTQKAWEISEKHWKSRDNMGNPGKHGKSLEIWESTENLRKRCEILENAVKNQEMLLKSGKCC